MNSVPLVDISPFFTSEVDKQNEVARQVDGACKDTGFLLISGHQVSEMVMSDYAAALRKFFAADPQTKESVAVGQNNGRGYKGKNSTALAMSRGDYSPPDLMERFTMGRFELPDDEYHRSKIDGHFAPNRWPSEFPKMERAGQRYFTEMERFAGTLMRIFARALGVSDDYFVQFMDRHISVLVANYYRQLTESAAHGQLRAGAHTDYGNLTILNPLGAQKGLQILRSDNVWEDVPNVPGAFVINIGDLMARWTNDRWISTMHRVLPADGSQGDRMSIAFFNQPNEDAVISCIPTCHSEAHPIKYEAVTSGEHYQLKSQRAYLGKS